jgi:hypothetical protein
MMVWSWRWRAMVTPMISGAEGSATSTRSNAASMRSPLMNCSEPARGRRLADLDYCLDRVLTSHAEAAAAGQP